MLKKKVLMVSIFVLAWITILSSANAVTVDGNTTLSTVGGAFNYTFSKTFSFDVVGVFTDRVQLDYINISLIPNGSTGNATVTLWNSTHKQMTICGNGQAFNLSFGNLSALNVLVNIGATKYSYPTDGANLTFTATPACTTVVLIEPRGAQSWAAGSRNVIVNSATCAGDTVYATYTYGGQQYLSGSLTRLIMTFVLPLVAIGALIFVGYLRFGKG